MSLNWDATDIERTRGIEAMHAIGVAIEGEPTFEQQVAWQKTEQIIFAAMVTGLGKKWNITAEEAPMIFDRLSAYEHIIDGPVWSLGDDGVKVRHWLTFQDILDRVGLHVNVSPVSQAAFERKLGQIALREAAARRNFEQRTGKAKG